MAFVSRSIAGTDLAHYHRFQKEAEALRFSFVQGLNHAHAEELTYQDASNWQVLDAYQFQSAMVFAYAAFWSLLCYIFSAWRQSGAMILMTLMGIWLLTAVVIPTGARLAVDRLVPLPSGAEILMLQRETVNDAWDLPREVTMEAFFARHPQWSDYKAVEDAFEWQWYYAFQQVGDQKTEHLAEAYRDGRLRRNRIAAWVSLVAPPSLLERTLQAIASTDVNASIAYEQEVRAYHAKLRAFYYPKFFRNAPFDKTAFENLRQFKPEQ